MAENKVEFEITVKTEEASKAIMKLSRVINKGLETKSSDSGIREKQKEFKELKKEIDGAISAKKELYGQSAAAKRIQGLQEQIDAAKELREASQARVDTLSKKDTLTGAEVNELSRLNATITAQKEKEVALTKELAVENQKYAATEQYAQKALAGMVAKHGEMLITEKASLGLAMKEEVARIKGTDAIKQGAEAEGQLAAETDKANSNLKQTSDNAKTAAGSIGQMAAEQEKANTAQAKDIMADKADATRKKLQEVLALMEQVNAEMQKDAGNTEIANIAQRMAILRKGIAAIKRNNVPEETKGAYTSAINNLEILKVKEQEYKKAVRDTAKETSVKRQITLDTINVAKNAGKTATSVANNSTRAAKRTSNALKTIKKGMSTLSRMLSVVKRGFSSLGAMPNKLKSSFASMAHSMRSNFKHLLTSLTKYILGFRSLFFLVRRLRKYIGEGIQNMAKFNDGNNHVNESITRLLSSLLFLKNAWATAFSPILQVVTPILEQLIDKIAEVGNAFSRFLGNLFGVGSVFQAVKVNAADYAKSLDSVGGSAGGASDKVKKLTDRLAAFDDLNVLGVDSDPDNGGSGGGGGSADEYIPDPNEMFKLTEVGQELLEKAKKFLADLKRMWEEADFTDLGKMFAEQIKRIFEYVNGKWPEIQKVANKLGNSIRTFFEGLFSDQTIWNDAGTAIAQGLNTLSTFINGLLGERGAKGEKTFNLGAGLANFVNQFFDDVDWGLINENIMTFVTKLRDNIISFLNNIDWKEMRSSARKFGSTLANIINETLGDERLMGSLGTTLAENFNTLITGINKFFVELDAEDLGDSIGTFFYNLFTKVDWFKVGKSISNSSSKILNALAAAFEELPADEIGDAITDLFDGIDWEKVFGALANVISASSKHATVVATAITEAVNEIVSDPEFSDTISGIIEAVLANLDIVGLTDALTEFALACFNAVLVSDDFLANVIKGFFEGLVNYLEGLDDEEITELMETVIGGPILAGIKKGIEKGFDDEGGVNEWVKLLIFGPIVAALIDLFEIGSPSKVMEEKGEYIIEGLKVGISNLIPDVEQIFTDFKDWLVEHWEEIRTKAVEKWINIKTFIVTKAQEIKDSALEKFNTFKDSVTEVWENIRAKAVEKFIMMRTAIVGTFETLKDQVKTPLNAFLDVIESLVNKAIDGINALFDKVNGVTSLGSDIATALGWPSIGKLTPIQHIDIPHLAMGAVIPPNKEFMAVLGDQSHGTNIEAPLDTIKQAVAEVLANNGNQEVIDLLQQLITVVEHKNLTIGDKEIGKAAARYNTQQMRLRGTNF